MTVIVGNDVPDAIRGHLKRWFIELKANVFVGTVNARTRTKLLTFVLKSAPPEMGLLIIQSAPNCQGYEIERIGPEGKTGRKSVDLSGIPLVAEKWMDYSEDPF